MTLNTSDIPLSTNFPRAEDVLKNNVPFDVGLLPLRDPDHFVSGQIHNYLDKCKFILEKDINDDKSCVLDWHKHGVDVNKFFRHFKGRHFDSNIPHKQYFQNSASCAKYADFISRELCERISTGCIKLLGIVGFCQPPKVVMPLTIEPSKPRLCHDERFLNLWIKDLPFHLGTLKDIHRLVQKNGLMVAFDDKSGYDHVKLNPYVYLPFGLVFPLLCLLKE